MLVGACRRLAGAADVVTAVAWDRREPRPTGRAPTLAPPPSVIVAAGPAASVGAALAAAFGIRVVPPAVDGIPSGAAVCVAVGPHDGRHRPKDSIGDFAGPVVLVGGRCSPSWSPSSGSLVIVPAATSTGDQLLAHAARWASAFQVPVWLTTVVERTASVAVTSDDLARTDLLASGLLHRMARQLSAVGVDAGWDVLYGRSVLHALRSFSSDPPPALIAMESPRPLTRRGNLWTVAHAVARVGGVPVLLLPTAAPEPRSVPPAPRPVRRPPPRATLPRLAEQPPRASATAPTTGWRARTAIAAIVLAMLASALGALGKVHVPYDSIHPGATPNLNVLIRVNGAATYPASGSVRLLTVETHRCTLFDALRGWFDPNVDVVPDHLERAEAARVWEASRQAMDDAKSTARLIVLRRLGFPPGVEVAFDTAHVVGPSGGLAFTLALLDSLTPGELTGDMDVAVTGTIDADGAVGPIGGLRQKIAAALAAGVDLLLVPASQRDDAVAYAHDSLPVVGVGSLSDALDALGRRGGDPLPPVSGLAGAGRAPAR